MKHFATTTWLLRLLLAPSILFSMDSDSYAADTGKFILVVHGGAGVWRNELREKECREGRVHHGMAPRNARGRSPR